PTTKGIYPVLCRGAFRRKQYHPYAGIFLGIVKGLVQLTGGLWPEGITDIGPVKCYSGNTATLPIGNVLKFPGNFPIDLILHFIEDVSELKSYEIKSYELRVHAYGPLVLCLNI